MSATTEFPSNDIGQGKRLLVLVQELRTRQRRYLADHLHDGAIQELSAAILGLYLMRGRPEAAQTDLLESAIRQVDRAAASVRSLMEEQERAGLPREDTRLAPAVRDQTAWLLASPAAVDIYRPQPELAAGQVSLIADVAELMLFLLTGDSPLPSAHLGVQVTRDAIRIDAAITLAGGTEIAHGCHADPAGLRARLRELATALAATEHVACEPDRVQARLTLPLGGAR